eukprot:CAMPEP_0197306814 /NCGR_PEP_ID=MMETSP0891-20130614/4035_1 /TAXON_ID=44058 ORGANISM="Aureoumbra lagunensis, Strain CCMP1510" /NCGR_SAMPLE_ID=MMETSP0891 /ASSEMBLY_ACC=CAM_ASM_000534 /LENGTH=278 /DNA_ID=CAMNT_0042789531 /DNA_START=29 /DNA_END=865 /DNA_ORIENTATION=-
MNGESKEDWTRGETESEEKSGEVKKRPGRRRRDRQQQEQEEEENERKEEVKDEASSSVRKPPTGWGEEPVESNIEVRDEEEIGNRRALAADEEENEENEVVIIPDLEEQEKEEIIFQVAEAPRQISRKLPALEELDAQLVSVSVSAKQKRLDLSALTCRLIPAAQVQEPQEPWDFDSLLQAVTHEFIAEAELDQSLRKNNVMHDESENKFAKSAQEASRAQRRRSSVAGGRRAKPKAERKDDDQADDKPSSSSGAGQRRRPVAADSSDELGGGEAQHK